MNNLFIIHYKQFLLKVLCFHDFDIEVHLIGVFLRTASIMLNLYRCF